MFFRGKEVLVWSINNYIGLSNEEEVRRVDEEAAREWGLGYPMGSRMMSGNTSHHEELENKLSKFMSKEDTILLNFGYQGMLSTVDALVDRNDVIVYDSECHACIIDGVRFIKVKDLFSHTITLKTLKKQLARASKITEQTGGGILVITEGVFGMSEISAKSIKSPNLNPSINSACL